MTGMTIINICMYLQKLGADGTMDWSANPSGGKIHNR